MEFDKFKGILDSVGKFNVTDIKPVLTDTSMFDLNRKKYRSPEEILEEDKDDLERPDFSEWKCKICDKQVEEGYFWYYLRDAIEEDKSVATCSKDCLDNFIKGHNCSNYEIYEYSRCNAYFKCEEIGNLRNMCEIVENKTYKSIFPLVSYNHCEPAQAGTILSTHKLTEVLVGFSKQTEEQFLSNKEMMEKSAEESSKQFKITTWMTLLVIVLTVVNLVPTMVDWGGNDYSDQLAGIESRIDGINSNNKLTAIDEKLSEITNLLSDVENGNGAERINEIINLLESIEKQLNNE